jgi:hypothetical protein
VRRSSKQQWMGRRLSRRMTFGVFFRAGVMGLLEVLGGVGRSEEWSGL